jgi:hypothetical protein
MAKKSILELPAHSLESNIGAVAISSTPKVPEIKGVKPSGSQILVELINDNEMPSKTTLTLPEGVSLDEAKYPQAYVLKLGPALPEDFWISVGSRVLLNGTGTNVPNYNNSPRKKLLVEPHTVKAQLEE